MDKYVPSPTVSDIYYTDFREQLINYEEHFNFTTFQVQELAIKELISGNDDSLLIIISLVKE